MSADAPLSYFYLQMLLGTNPLRRCAPAPPKGELFSVYWSAAIKLCLRGFCTTAFYKYFLDLLPQMQETAALIRIISSRTMVFFTSSTNYFFSA